MKEVLIVIVTYVKRNLESLKQTTMDGLCVLNVTLKDKELFSQMNYFKADIATNPISYTPYEVRFKYIGDLSLLKRLESVSGHVIIECHRYILLFLMDWWLPKIKPSYLVEYKSWGSSGIYDHCISLQDIFDQKNYLAFKTSKEAEIFSDKIIKQLNRFARKEEKLLHQLITESTGTEETLQVEPIQSTNEITDFVHIQQDFEFRINNILFSANADEPLTIQVTAKLSGNTDECFVGIWYGIEFFQNDIKIGELPLNIHGDSMLLSDLASKRRLTHLTFVRKMAEYIEFYIQTVPRFYHQNYPIETVTIENIVLGEELFNQEIEKTFTQ